MKKILAIICTLQLLSCTNSRQEDTRNYPDCSKLTKFKNECSTECNIANVDSILIESCPPKAKFGDTAIHYRYYKITNKVVFHKDGPFGLWHRAYWVFDIPDSLNIDYDYIFSFPDNGVIRKYILTDLTIEPLASFKSDKINYVCGLGSWKINGHTYYGGNFEF